jgi:hypothetical protein
MKNKYTDLKKVMLADGHNQATWNPNVPIFQGCEEVV